MRTDNFCPFFLCHVRMSGRDLFWISPCRSSLQQNSCVHQMCSHQGPVFPGQERTSFPCSRDLPETDPLLSSLVIINESDWSSFTSLQGYLRWGFPPWLPESHLPPRSAAGHDWCPPQHPMPPCPHKQTRTVTPWMLVVGCQLPLRTAGVCMPSC